MRIVDLIFQLLIKFVPGFGSNANKAELLAEAQQWYGELQARFNNMNNAVKKEGVEPLSDLQFKIMRFCEAWYGRIAFAILFIPMTRFLFDYMRGSTDADEKEEAF